VFTTRDNKIYYGKTIEYKIKGINWFGLETECRCVHGLWIHDTAHYMDLLRGWSFNSIRVPVSFEIAMNLDHAVNPACVIAEPGIAGWSARRYVHHLFYHAKIRGMSILLDLHSDHGAIQPSPTSRVSLEDNLEAWRRLLLEYGSYDNLIGIDDLGTVVLLYPGSDAFRPSKPAFFPGAVLDPGDRGKRCPVGRELQDHEHAAGQRTG
jgi:endoglucanase